MIKIGDLDPNAIYIGAQPVSAVYVEGTKVWPPSTLTITSTSISTDGSELTLFFNENIASGGNGFTMRIGCTEISCTPVDIFENTIALSLSATVYLDDAEVLLDYVPGDVLGVGGGTLAAFTGLAVTNNSTIPAPVNLMPEPRDVDQWSWHTQPSATIQWSLAAGIDEAVAATRGIDTDAAVNMQGYQDITLTPSTNRVSMIFWIKQDLAYSGDAPVAQFNFDWSGVNTRTRVQVNPVDGGHTLLLDQTGGGEVTVQLRPKDSVPWYRVVVTFPDNNHTGTHRVYFWPASNTSSGVNGPNGTVMDAFQVYANMNHAEAVNKRDLYCDASAIPTTVDWLEDQPPTYAAYSGWPRMDTGHIKNTGMTAAQLAVFDVVCAKPFYADNVAAAQALNPNLQFLRILSPRAYQGYGDSYGSQASGFPFETTGPVTDASIYQMFAGHWAYGERTNIINATLSAGALTFTAADPSKLTVGQWICIADNIPPEDFTNAEHMLVDAIVGSTVTVSQRGYKSSDVDHPAGSYVYPHLRGDGSEPLLWSYNQSSACPVDGNNKKANEALAEWAAANYDKDADGNASVARVDGIINDADYPVWWDTSQALDSNINGIADMGWATNDTNAWRDGLEEYYANTRAALVSLGKGDTTVIGGDWKSFGLISNHGAQTESFPDGVYNESGEYPLSGNYWNLSCMISAEKAQMTSEAATALAPRLPANQSKSASALYGGAADNLPIRFMAALSTIFGGHCSNQNGFGGAFHYLDEYAVDGTGIAVPSTDPATALANKHWLGSPTGNWGRVHDPAAWSIDNALYADSDVFTGWTGVNCTPAVVQLDPYTGTNCLSVTINTHANRASDSAYLYAANGISLVSGQSYTVCFAIRASETMNLRVRMGPNGQTITDPVSGSGMNGVQVMVIPGDGEWHKQVVVIHAIENNNRPLRFDCGLCSTGSKGQFWIDQIAVFAGDANIFKREFDNGLVIANGTRSQQVIDLEGTFKRIDGTQDAVNDGATVSQETVEPFDGRFFVRL